jgi:probable FeS assembly SUF system protein SufT
MYGTREEVTLAREVTAIQIPDGTKVALPAGTRGVITQELGASFTVMTEYGAMYRIDQSDADALGKEVAASDLPEEAPSDPEELEKLVWDQMRKCYDPEIPVNIVDLGLVYDCQVVPAEDGGGHRVEIKMTLTAPGCGMGPVLAEDVRVRIDEIPGVEETRVEVVLDPPWTPGMMTEAARLQLGFM